MSFQVGDKVVVVKDIFGIDPSEGGICVGMKGEIVGFDNRCQVLLDTMKKPLGFDEFELELLK